MTDGKSNPPGRAIWFLQHMCPGDNEPLTGDLIEKFREGRTRGWFWRQVFIAFAVSVLVVMRRHWPCLCYAIAGTPIPSFIRAADRVPVFHYLLSQWSTLSWRYGGQRFAGEIFVQYSVLAALPLFAVALAINRQFRWPIVFRTGVINVVLLALLWWSLDVLDTFQSTTLPIENRHFLWLMPLKTSLIRLLYFSIFLVSAWLGRISRVLGHEPAWRSS